jgi:ethanolamine utilization protein EutA
MSHGGHDGHDSDDLEHDHDGLDEHRPVGGAQADGVDAAIWAVDNVELTTVGIDIGSATSHLLFSHLHLRRQAHGYSSRFVVVARRVLARSPIWLTPYEPGGLIDAEQLREWFATAYEEAGLRRDAVDAGAVILTGVALERQNARRIAELFAGDGGRFVCASAGHNLEALLAAHGSGSVAASSSGEPVLNIDVGGGTTKLALCEGGRVAATMAIWGGARLVVVDRDGVLTRAEPAIQRLAGHLAPQLTPGAHVSPVVLDQVADAIAAQIAAAASGSPPSEPPLAGGLPAAPRYGRIVLSGGVAEYIRRGSAQVDPAVIGDLGPRLAAALQRHLATLGVPVDIASESIRATVIGASQFSLQLSGNTIHLSGPIDLPVHGVPVVTIELDGEGDGLRAQDTAAMIERRVGQLDLDAREEAVAIAVSWDGIPVYRTLRAIAEGVVLAHRSSQRREAPIMVVLDADVGASVGAIIRDELGITSGVIAIDGVELSDLDFIDVGEHILPANVVPVVIKSLVFPHDGEARPRILGSV